MHPSLVVHCLVLVPACELLRHGGTPLDVAVSQNQQELVSGCLFHASFLLVVLHAAGMRRASAEGGWSTFASSHLGKALLE